jgi:hypothetical protein
MPTERELLDMKATKKTVNISFTHGSKNASSFVSPIKTTSALMTERTHMVSPPEHSQYSAYNNNYGYGYGYSTLQTTKQTGSNVHLSWHHHNSSKDADAQTDIQLTARPQ